MVVRQRKTPVPDASGVLVSTDPAEVSGVATDFPRRSDRLPGAGQRLVG